MRNFEIAMYLGPRHEKILEVAKIEDRVLVDDLAVRFEVAHKQ